MLGEWKIKGKVWRFGDDINTDLIIPGKYKFKTLNMKELASHAMEDVNPDFAKKVRIGDLIAAGKNFGCGSSREHAPRVLKELGVSAVVAHSFARIFFRNSINVGLPLVESKEASGSIGEGELIEIDLEEGLLKNISKGISFSFKPMPTPLLNILRNGGLINYLKKIGSYELSTF